MSSSQPESGSNGSSSPYVQMLLGFGTIPKWHNFLSTLLVWMITTGFIFTPSTLIHLKSSGLTSDGQPVYTNVLVLAVSSAPLFATSISLVSVGLIGMFVLSRYHIPNQIPLKDNYFWLCNKYYLRVAEGGICGLAIFLENILEFRNKFGKVTRPSIGFIATVCVTCSIKTLYSGLAVWSYFKTRRAMKAHETPQDQADKPQTEDPYVRMLLGVVTLPGWHVLLSTLLTFLIFTGFVTIPPSLIALAERSRETNLFKKFVLSEPQFGICVLIFFVGFIGMFALSRYRYLKNNHFWLYHNYYRRMVEAGIYGILSLLFKFIILLSIDTHPPASVVAPPIAVTCVMCIITALFSGLAGWEYFKMRRAMKAHETPQAESSFTEEPQSDKLQAEVSHFSSSPST